VREFEGRGRGNKPVAEHEDDENNNSKVVEKIEDSFYS
jgi:hypothetical protein